MNKKILISLSVIALAAAVVVGGTVAFFSDTETSTGNTFTAGAIDLTIDNTSYVTNNDGVLVASPNTSWDLGNLSDLGTRGGSNLPKLFFNFVDLKPGDMGEDTISLRVIDNDAWLCAATRITADDDVSYSEPELGDDKTILLTTPELADGELDEELNFVFWADDGDNVLEREEVASIFLQGPISGIGQAGQIALADATTNIWTGTGPVKGGETFFIGKAWCFGNLTVDAVIVGGDGTPVDRGTGIACDGRLVNNASQTDRVVGDISFTAVQSRNNDSFVCSAL